MSGLETQLVPVVFNKGLDTKSNNKVAAENDTLVDLQNMVFTTTERVTKRYGYAAQTRSILGGGSLSAGVALAARGSELLLADGTSLYSATSASGTAAWANKGPLLSPTVTTTPLMSSQYSLAGYDATVTSAGLCCVVAEQWSPTFSWTSAGVIYSLVDLATGDVLVAPTLVNGTGSSAPKVITGSGFFMIYYVLAGVLRCTTVNQSTFAVADVAITTGAGTTALGTTHCYDAIYSGSALYTAFVNAAATNGITCVKSTAATPGTITNTSIVPLAGAAAATVSLCVDQFNGNIVEAFTTSANVQFNVITASSLAGVTGPTVLDATAGMGAVTCVSTSASASAIRIYATFYGTTDHKNLIRQNTLGAAYAVGAASVFQRGAALAGRAFADNGSAYVPVSFSAGSAISGLVFSAQATLFVLNANAVAVAKAYAGNFGGFYVNANSFFTGSRPSTLPETTSYAFGASWVLPAAVVTRLSQNGVTSTSLAQTCAVSCALLTLSDTINGYVSTQLAGTTLFSGSIVNNYDGGQSSSGYPSAAEHGFNYFPFSVSIAAGAGTAGTYQYVVTYEWTDQTGVVHRSAPSVAASTTNIGGTLTIPTLRLTQKTSGLRGGVRIVVYRTATLGTVFYQVNNTGALSDALLNDMTVDTVTYTDNLADTAASANAQLYTTGGVLQNYAPNPLAAVITHRNRVWGIDTTSPLSLWYSKQVTQSTNVAAGSPVEFSAFLTFNVDPKGGPCTALASLDDKLIVFKADRIFAVTGQGPDSTGAQSDFSDAQLVTGDTGCTAPRSMVLTPAGLMFFGKKGIYLLDRGLSCRYIGAPVEGYVNDATMVVGAQLIPTTNQVRFILGTAINYAVVYDYFVGQWSVFTTATNGYAVASIVFGSSYYFLDSIGVLYREDPTLYYDRLEDASMSPIQIGLTTSWLSFAGQQGFKRVRRLLLEGCCGDPTISREQMLVTLSYNYGDNTPPLKQSVFFFPYVTAAGNVGGNFQERIHCTLQKCDSVQVAISSIGNPGPNDGSSQYLDLTAITLEVAAKRGAFKLPASASTA